MKTICWNCSNFIWIWLKKQDEIIYRLGKIVARQATDIQLLKNDREFSDDKLTEDTAIVDEVIGQYNDMKSELEP